MKEKSKYLLMVVKCNATFVISSISMVFNLNMVVSMMQYLVYSKYIDGSVQFSSVLVKKLWFWAETGNRFIIEAEPKNINFIQKKKFRLL